MATKKELQGFKMPQLRDIAREKNITVGKMTKDQLIKALVASDKGVGMKMTDVRQKAKQLDITPGRMNKVDLIHAIQQAENYTPCFGQAQDHCQHDDCCFIKDCLTTTV